MKDRRALITGISGQDGSYLAEFLLGQGYEVWGIVRSSPTGAFPNLEEIRDRITLLQGDLLDQLALIEALQQSRPHELYHLAATSFVPASWHQPVMTAQFTAVGVTSMLEAIRLVNPELRVYQASSSEIFGATSESPQRETTPFRPTNPYGVAKLYGHLMAASYRERYGLHVSSGIAFNHESPRRPLEFVTRKVTHAAAAISQGLQEELLVGDLNATRDWGFAGDYVEAMWATLQSDSGDDYVIATGRAHSVRDLVDLAFDHVGLDPARHVRVDERFVRREDPITLVGDPAKAATELDWRPRTSFDDLVRLMVDADLHRIERGAARAEAG